MPLQIARRNPQAARFLKAFSVFVNGKEKAFDLPWNHPNPDDILTIAADSLPAPQPTMPVLYIEKIAASTHD